MSKRKRLRVYLAGPEVFLSDSAAIGEAKKEICKRHGFKGVFPGDVPPEYIEPDKGPELFRCIVKMMRRADLVIANMTPFRGVSMDVGTAVEIGYMYARKKPVFGYTNVVAGYAERVAPDGMSVEPFGFTDNLMCVAPIIESKASVVRTDVPGDEKLRDLRGFEECVRQAAARLGVTPR